MCLFFGSLGLLSKTVRTKIVFISDKDRLHFRHTMTVVPGRCVCSEALDEERHRDDEADAHEEDAVPD